MTSSSRGEEGVLYPCIRALCHSEAHTDREFIGVTRPPTPPPAPPPPPLPPPQAFAFLNSHRQEIKCKFPQPETTNLMLQKRTKRNSTAEKVVHRLMQANLCCPPGSPEKPLRFLSLSRQRMVFLHCVLFCISLIFRLYVETILYKHPVLRI